MFFIFWNFQLNHVAKLINIPYEVIKSPFKVDIQQNFSHSYFWYKSPSTLLDVSSSRSEKDNFKRRQRISVPKSQWSIKDMPFEIVEKLKKYKIDSNAIGTYISRPNSGLINRRLLHFTIHRHHHKHNFLCSTLIRTPNPQWSEATAI